MRVSSPASPVAWSIACSCAIGLALAGCGRGGGDATAAAPPAATPVARALREADLKTLLEVARESAARRQAIDDARRARGRSLAGGGPAGTVPPLAGAEPEQVALDLGYDPATWAQAALRAREAALLRQQTADRAHERALAEATRAAIGRRLAGAASDEERQRLAAVIADLDQKLAALAADEASAEQKELAGDLALIEPHLAELGLDHLQPTPTPSPVPAAEDETPPDDGAEAPRPAEPESPGPESPADTPPPVR